MPKNRPSRGKTKSTWPEAEVWDKHHMNRGYVRDQSDISVLVDTASGWIEVFLREIEPHKQ